MKWCTYFPSWTFVSYFVTLIPDEDRAGLFLLDTCTGPQDLTGYGNNGTYSDDQLVSYIPGPPSIPYEVLSFTDGLYVDLPNNDLLDVKYSLSILLHVYITEAQSAPLVSFGPGGEGVNLWQKADDFAFFRATSRDGVLEATQVGTNS